MDIDLSGRLVKFLRSVQWTKPENQILVLNEPKALRLGAKFTLKKHDNTLAKLARLGKSMFDDSHAQRQGTFWRLNSPGLA